MKLIPLNEPKLEETVAAATRSAHCLKKAKKRKSKAQTCRNTLEAKGCVAWGREGGTPANRCCCDDERHGASGRLRRCLLLFFLYLFFFFRRVTLPPLLSSTRVLQYYGSTEYGERFHLNLSQCSQLTLLARKAEKRMRFPGGAPG